MGTHLVVLRIKYLVILRPLQAPLIVLPIISLILLVGFVRFLLLPRLEDRVTLVVQNQFKAVHRYLSPLDHHCHRVIRRQLVSFSWAYPRQVATSFI